MVKGFEGRAMFALLCGLSILLPFCHATPIESLLKTASELEASVDSFVGLEEDKPDGRPLIRKYLFSYDIPGETYKKCAGPGTCKGLSRCTIQGLTVKNALIFWLQNFVYHKKGKTELGAARLYAHEETVTDFLKKPMSMCHANLGLRGLYAGGTHQLHREGGTDQLQREPEYDAYVYEEALGKNGKPMCTATPLSRLKKTLAGPYPFDVQKVTRTEADTDYKSAYDVGNEKLEKGEFYVEFQESEGNPVIIDDKANEYMNHYYCLGTVDNFLYNTLYENCENRICHQDNLKEFKTITDHTNMDKKLLDLKMNRKQMCLHFCHSLIFNAFKGKPEEIKYYQPEVVSSETLKMKEQEPRYNEHHPILDKTFLSMCKIGATSRSAMSPNDARTSYERKTELEKIHQKDVEPFGKLLGIPTRQDLLRPNYVKNCVQQSHTFHYADGIAASHEKTWDASKSDASKSNDDLHEEVKEVTEEEE